MSTQPWTRIRVSKFTWNIHPNDWQRGLPLPQGLEEEHCYRSVLVRKNQKGEWTGQDLNVTNWLIQNEPKEDAQPIQAEAAEVPTEKKATRKRGRKRKALQ